MLFSALFGLGQSDSIASNQSKQVSEFVLYELDGFENLRFVPSSRDDHLATAEDQADDLRVVEPIDESWELLRLVLDLVERQVEGQIVQIESARYRC